MAVLVGVTAARRRTTRMLAGVVGLAAALAVLARADEAAARGGETGAGAAATARQVLADAAGGSRLPASSAMPVGEDRLPPPGYLDYCLRFRGRDQGCAL